MKKTLKKSLFNLVVILLAIGFLLSSFYSLSNNIIANANVRNLSTLESDDDILEDYERMIANTREEYRDLKEISYGAAFDAEMEKRGLSVGESLVEQICYYQEMLCTTNDKEER